MSLKWERNRNEGAVTTGEVVKSLVDGAPDYYGGAVESLQAEVTKLTCVVAALIDTLPARHIEYGRWAVTCRCGASGVCANTGPNATDAAKIKAYQDARSAWNTRTTIKQAEQPDNTGEPGVWPLRAQVWKRESTQEWVLEIEGTLGDTDMNIRHTQPLSVAYENVPGLPTLYTHPAPSVPATGEPVEWLDAMLADTREVFDAGGSETPQVVRDVIEYVASWVTVYSEKNHPAPSVPGDVVRDAERYRFILAAADDMTTSRYKSLCELLGVAITEDFDLGAAIDAATLAAKERS